MRIRKTLIIMLLALPLVFGCNSDPLPNAETKKELLVYCGITMAHALREAADIFEQKSDSRIRILQDGSGLLYRSIEINKTGDLYLPGSESYIERGIREGYVNRTEWIGSNQAALFVAKGNPLQIAPNLKALTDPHIRSAIGLPEMGSIGRETERILTGAGLYEIAIKRSQYLSHDSKDLYQQLKNGKIDLTLNWAAVASIEANRASVDIIRLPSEIAPHHKLIIGRLKYSTHPKLVANFMNFLISAEGQEIFINHGLARSKGDKP